MFAQKGHCCVNENIVLHCAFVLLGINAHVVAQKTHRHVNENIVLSGTNMHLIAYKFHCLVNENTVLCYAVRESHARDCTENPSLC